MFTTIQKFLPEAGNAYPLLSERRNIVFIADEAHRSQYGFGARVVQNKKDDAAHITYGFAKHLRDALPNASFIGFTGTPVELTDRSTLQVFGDYIDIYDIQRAVEDGATVRIYSKWARLEAMIGADKRIRLIAKDIIAHFENRQTALDSKAMIVCMSRRICVALYDEIIKLRPEWPDADDQKGSLKIVMTGSAADGPLWQPHTRSGNKARREKLAERFKDETDPLKLVIVRDMWLTGFDAPSLHTMYVDKPMRGHGLMQAIARVNRVFSNKPSGLVVDYLGLAHELKQALAAYTKADRDLTGIPQERAVEILLEKHEVVAGMFHNFDYSKFVTRTPHERLVLIPAGMDHILQQKDGKPRYLQAVTELSKAFALAVPHESALVVRAGFVKATVNEDGKTQEDLDTAVRQIVSRAVASDQIVDIFAAAGLKTPDISILSDEFLAEVKAMPQKNLALELLRKLLNDELRSLSRTNLIQSRSFAEMLERTIHQYQNRSIETAQVITALIDLAKQMRGAHQRGEDLGLSEEELAFYDALEVNDSAVKVLGDETLRLIARELVETVRRNVSIDWTVRESVRAKLRTIVKRVLRKHGYPPDKQEKATLTVLEQAELIAKDWAE